MNFVQCIIYPVYCLAKENQNMFWRETTKNIAKGTHNILFYLWMPAKFQSSLKRLHFEETLMGKSGVFNVILLAHKDYTKTSFSEFSRQYFADGFSIVSLSVQLKSYPSKFSVPTKLPLILWDINHLHATCLSDIQYSSHIGGVATISNNKK